MFIDIKKTNQVKTTMRAKKRKNLNAATIKNYIEVAVLITSKLRKNLLMDENLFVAFKKGAGKNH